MVILDGKHYPIEIYNFGSSAPNPSLGLLFASPALQLCNPRVQDDAPWFTIDNPGIVTVGQLAEHASVLIADDVQCEIDPKSLLSSETNWHFWKLRMQPGMMAMYFVDLRQAESLSPSLLVNANLHLLSEVVVKVKSIHWMQLGLFQMSNRREDARYYDLKAGYLTDDRDQANPMCQFIHVTECSLDNEKLRSIRHEEKLV